MDKFHTYFKSLSKSERAALAEAAGTSVAYLWQIAYRQRRCQEGMAIEIDKSTGGAVRVDDLCPDVDWEYVRTSAQSIADHGASSIVDRAGASDDVQPPVGGVEE